MLSFVQLSHAGQRQHKIELTTIVLFSEKKTGSQLDFLVFFKIRLIRSLPPSPIVGFLGVIVIGHCELGALFHLGHVLVNLCAGFVVDVC